MCLLTQSGGSEKVGERPKHGGALPGVLGLSHAGGGDLGSSSGTATYQLCDVGHFIEPLCASVSTPIKWV